MKNLFKSHSRWHLKVFHWVSRTNSLASLAFSWKSSSRWTKIKSGQKKNMCLAILLVPLFGMVSSRDLFWKGCKRDLQLRGVKRSLWITRWMDLFFKCHPDETHPKVPPKFGEDSCSKVEKPFGAWCLYISPFVKRFIPESWRRSAYFCVHLRKKSRMIFVHPEPWKLTAFTKVWWISHHMMDSHLWRNPPMMDPMYHQMDSHTWSTNGSFSRIHDFHQTSFQKRIPV